VQQVFPKFQVPFFHHECHSRNQHSQLNAMHKTLSVVINVPSVSDVFCSLLASGTVSTKVIISAFPFVRLAPPSPNENLFTHKQQWKKIMKSTAEKAQIECLYNIKKIE
jgi:hypothetical protein